MKIKIDAIEMPKSPLHTTSDTYCYPIVMNQQTMTTDDMVNHIQNVCTLTKVDCNAVIEAVGEYIIKTITEGNVVHIDGLGTFSSALSFTDSTKDAALQKATDVLVTDINFRPEREVMLRLKASMDFERKEAVRSSHVNIATVVLQLQEFFKTNRQMTARQFESEFGFKRTRANTMLNTLVNQQKLARTLAGQTYIYYEGTNLYPPQPSPTQK